MIAVGSRWIDLQSGLVREGDQSWPLSEREVRLLAVLLAADGRPVSAERLLTEVFGPEGTVEALLPAINRLRRKVEPDPRKPRYLRTLRNEGYAFLPGAQIQAGPVAESLLGRSTELDELSALAVPGAVITILGPGGAGKTSIAKALLASVGDGLFVEFATARDLPDVVRLLGDALRAPFDGKDPDRDLQRLGGLLAQHRMVVLDNAESCIDAIASAVQRLRGRTALVVTSRVVLGVDGERRFDLGPLSADAARRLFARRAEDVSGPLEPSDVPFVDRLVERLDRLPLAILLAAGRAGAMRPEQILGRLLDHAVGLDLARGATADMPARHRGLSAAFEGSWELLDPQSQRILGVLSVFPAAFSVDQADEVAQEAALPALQIALDGSLARLVGPGRISFYETTRELVAASLMPAERRAAEIRHAELATLLAERLVPGLDRIAPEPRARMQELIPDLLAAASRAIPPDLRARAALCANAVLAPRGHLAQRIALLDSVLAVLDSPAVRLARGQAHDRAGHVELANLDFQAALRLSQASGDRRSEAIALTELGIQDQRRGRDGTARFEAAIAVALSLGELALSARAEMQYGRMLADHGDAQRGEAMLIAAAARLAELGDARYQALARLNLSIVQRVLDRDDLAEASNRAALELTEQIGDLRLHANTLVHLAVLTLDRGRPLEALETLSRVARVADDLHEPRLIWVARLHTVRALIDSDQPDPAIALAGQLPLDAPELASQAVYVTAAALTRRGDFAEAARRLDGFEFDAHRDHELFDLARSLRIVLAVRLGDRATAERLSALPCEGEMPLVHRARAIAAAFVQGDASPEPVGMLACDLRLLRYATA